MYAEINKDEKIIAFHETKGKSRINISDEDWGKVLESSKAAYIKNGKVVFKPYKKTKQELEFALMNLCDQKQEDAEKFIIGYKATPKQIERYKDKYKRAKAGEFDDVKNQAVITLYEQMLGTIRGFTDMIEDYRSFVSDLLVANQLDKAEKAIILARDFNKTTTPSDVASAIAKINGAK
ncbi:MAG: hypothetical protein ACWIPH_05895 [Ostreibacterium sp.]